MISIGITGGIGSGKSLVSKIIETMGFEVFNSDLEAKNIVDSNAEVRSELIAVCGEEIYNGAKLNRPALAQKIFSDDQIREAVNKIIHPRVRQAFEDLKSRSNKELIFNEAAILIETGAHTNFDKIILVTASESVRIERVMIRDGVSEVEVKARIAKQWTDAKKAQYSDFLINNDGEEPLLTQVEACVTQLSSS